MRSLSAFVKQHHLNNVVGIFVLSHVGTTADSIEQPTAAAGWRSGRPRVAGHCQHDPAWHRPMCEEFQALETSSSVFRCLR